MAVSEERLVAILEARIRDYEKNLAKALKTTNQQFNKIETRGKQLEARMARIGGAVGNRFAVALGAAFAGVNFIQGAKNLSEAATRIDNSLKVAGVSAADLDKIYNRLSASAKANGAPIETLAGLYGKAAQAQKELGVNSEELLAFTNNVALALRVAGTDAQTASGALLQLGQALGAGKVQAEEFNSILDGAPTIAQAVAAGLKEAGGSVSQLKKLVIEGKISSEAFFRAFEAGAPMLQQKVSESTFTIAQSMTNLQTALIDVAREFNNSTGASENLAGGINALAQTISRFDVSGFIDEIQRARDAFGNFVSDLGNADIFTKLNELAGITKNGLVVNVEKEQANAEVKALENEVKTLQERIALNTELGFDNAGAMARLDEVLGKLAQVRNAAANLPDTVTGYTVGPNGVVPELGGDASPTNGQMGGSSRRGGARSTVVQPVSINDFAPPVGSKSGGSKSGGGAGKTDSYEREIQQIEERTAALQAETAAQAGINPLIEDYGYAVEKAKASSDLLNAAKRAGIAITPQLSASIDALAEGYAQASVEAQKLAKSQDEARQAAEDMRSGAKDILGGFISDLKSGTSLADAFANALSKIGDKLLDMALNSIFSGSGTGGLLGGAIIPGILHSGGTAGKDGYGHGRAVSPGTFAGARRYHSGGVAGLKAGEVPAILQRGEVVLPRNAKASSAGSSSGAVDVRVSVDNDGNLQAYVTRTAQQQASGVVQAGISKYDAALPGRISETMERRG